MIQTCEDKHGQLHTANNGARFKEGKESDWLNIFRLVKVIYPRMDTRAVPQGTKTQALLETI
jgi:hypothetical protein